MTDDDFDAAWGRINDPAADPVAGDQPAAADAVSGGDGQGAGPPVRVTLLVKADRVPVAPWAQGWRIGSIGPVEGHVTLICEHDIDASPIAQLAAITGLLSTVKQAQLDVAWWAIQSRAPFPGEAVEEPDLAQQLSDFLIDSDEQRAAGD